MFSYVLHNDCSPFLNHRATIQIPIQGHILLVVHIHIVQGTHNQYDFGFSPLLAPLTQKMQVSMRQKAMCTET